MRRLIAPLVLAGVIANLVTGCSLVAGDAPTTAAERLAAGLSDLDLGDVPLTSETDRDRFAQAVEQVRDMPVEVSVSGVSEGGDHASVALAWSWNVAGHAWAYETTVELVSSAGTWEAEWQPSSLAPDLESDEALDVDILTGQRGDVLGAGGTPLVTLRPVVRYGLDKSSVRPRRWATSATKIAEAVDVDVDDYVETVKAYGPEAFVEAIVVRQDDALEGVDPSYGDIPGAAALDDRIPLAPSREFAAPIIGSVGPATAETIKESGGQLEEGDQVGLSGLQARYDEQLQGSDGVRVQAVAGDGTERALFTIRAADGRDLRTTLDPDLQLKAEGILAQHVAPTGPDSAIVALRPSTGEILVAANGPANEGFNAATAGQYAPGSTFKIITALALLRSGMAPEDAVECDDTTVVDGRSFKNYDAYPSDQVGTITLSDTIAHSCNTALIDARDRLGESALADAAAALGLGVDHELGFPAYFGQAPAPAGETEKAADLIGQGKILASPLTMATVAASVAADRAVLPTLLPDHDVTHVAPAAPLTATEAAQLRELMRGVVTRGSGTFLADLPGDVGAKTGTAEYGQPLPDGSLATHSWMIAVHGDLAVAVFVETGTSGSQTAGPILEDFLA